ncbi:MAG: hypothetical protein ABIQ81_03165 [Novosphingobium sp.]
MTSRPVGPARRRGQPLVVLGAVLLCWVGVRAGVWRAELSEAAISPPAWAPQLAVPHMPTVVPDAARALPLRLQAAPAFRPSSPHPLFVRLATPLTRPREIDTPLPGPRGQQAREALALAPGPGVRALAAASFPIPSVAPTFSGRDIRAARRWSADAWTLVRRGGGVASSGPSAATYGASQVGAVLRYRLWPSDPHRPTAYLRVSAALNGSAEREAAAGVSVRPIAGLPVFVAGEGRISRLSSRTFVRPAVMAVTELAPVTLPKGARAEFYLQAGYVGGLGATPFVDGQLRIDRAVGRVGGVEARVGAGTWGGAQRGVSRLDLGPTATLQVAQGPLAMRLGVDWRFRLAGSAAPASGPALTISAGF